MISAACASRRRPFFCIAFNALTVVRASATHSIHALTVVRASATISNRAHTAVRASATLSKLDLGSLT